MNITATSRLPRGVVTGSRLQTSASFSSAPHITPPFTTFNHIVARFAADSQNRRRSIPWREVGDAARPGVADFVTPARSRAICATVGTHETWRTPGWPTVGRSGESRWGEVGNGRQDGPAQAVPANPRLRCTQDRIRPSVELSRAFTAGASHQGRRCSWRAARKKWATHDAGSPPSDRTHPFPRTFLPRHCVATG